MNSATSASIWTFASRASSAGIALLTCAAARPELQQFLMLIPHQGDERRHDYRHAGQEQCRKLIAQGLPCPSWHHRERVPPGHHRLDHRLLANRSKSSPKTC
jgi:hypothetical protein